MDKPINIIIEDFKESLVKLTNDSGLPLFVLDSIYKEIANEIHISYLQQVKSDKEKWEKSQMAESEE